MCGGDFKSVPATEYARLVDAYAKALEESRGVSPVDARFFARNATAADLRRRLESLGYDENGVKFEDSPIPDDDLLAGQEEAEHAAHVGRAGGVPVDMPEDWREKDIVIDTDLEDKYRALKELVDKDARYVEPSISVPVTSEEEEAWSERHRAELKKSLPLEIYEELIDKDVPAKEDKYEDLVRKAEQAKLELAIGFEQYLSAQLRSQFLSGLSEDQVRLYQHQFYVANPALYRNRLEAQAAVEAEFARMTRALNEAQVTQFGNPVKVRYEHD